ncbi:MAG: response regulator transcription factor [Phycisphaerales bacterium]|nr:response regulator transcription factor [Phycisphaerales bacterium]
MSASIRRPRVAASGQARVVVVDEQPLLRAGLVHVLTNERDLVVVGDTDTVERGRRLVLDLTPDVVVTELGHGRDDGLAFIRWVGVHRPDARVVALSARPPEVYAERALRAGARAFVTKTEPLTTVVAAVRAAVGGRLRVPTDIAQRLMFASVTGQGGEVGIEALTDRELQVFELMGRGLSTRAIGAALCVSEKTVATHRSRIKDKLQLEGLGEVLRRAVLWVEGDVDHPASCAM